jgi:hypothetical protein
MLVRDRRSPFAALQQMVRLRASEMAVRYREHAARCLRMAQREVDLNERFAPIDMAQAWIALAERAEKNEALNA